MKENLYTTESVKGKIGKIVRKIKGEADMSKTWFKSSNEKMVKKFERKDLTDEEYETMKKCFDNIHSSKTYREYKPEFDKLCKFCGISPDGVIFRKHKLQKGKDNKNIFYAEYIKNTTKIVIPSDSALYHMTRVPDLKELTPCFKGKSDKGYLYDSPRVYFSIRKKMPRYAADYKKSESNMYKYVTKEDIKVAYVDPLVWDYSLGAVYVETDYPIKVIKYEEEVRDPNKDKEEKDVKENAVFESIYDFMEAYGLEEVDETIYTESMKSFIGKHVRDINDTKSIKRGWDEIMKKFVKTTAEREVSEKEIKSLKSSCDLLFKKDISFIQYKIAFNKICKFMGLPADETVINGIRFTKKNNKNFIEVDFSKGRKKVIVPNGTYLVKNHKRGIKELNPEFKSGKSLYPSSRVFFNLSKEENPKNNNSENAKYTPEENVKIAYIDSSYNHNGGSVYVDTKLPIPVIELYEKIKNKINRK